MANDCQLLILWLGALLFLFFAYADTVTILCVTGLLAMCLFTHIFTKNKRNTGRQAKIEENKENE